jgi:hypothetical protein
MSSHQATSPNPPTSPNLTPSSNQGGDSDPDSPPAPSLTPSSPDPRSPSLPGRSPMPAWEDVESNIGSNDAGGRNYTEFSRLLRNGQHSFRGSLQSEYGAADIESSREFTDEEYDTDDVGAPEWPQLGLDTSGWDNTL